MVQVTILGVAQDGGRPHAGCTKPCCSTLNQGDVFFPVSLGILDDDNTSHLVEASRNLGEQMRYLWKLEESNKASTRIDHVWLTHAHWGHVDGLGLFGRETMNARGVKLHVSKSMADLVERTPAWRIMVEQGVFNVNIFHDTSSIGSVRVEVSPTLTVEAVPVPHRAELSDTHAFLFRGPTKSLLFLPDHDTWGETLSMHDCSSITEWLHKLKVDIALFDGTFWSLDELGSRRSMKEVPHPPVSKTLAMLGNRSGCMDDNVPDVYFIHLNHTNPLFVEESVEYQRVIEMGWNVARQGQKFTL